MARKRVKLSGSQRMLYQIAELDRANMVQQATQVYGARVVEIIKDHGLDIEKDKPFQIVTKENDDVYIEYGVDEPEGSVPLSNGRRQAVKKPRKVGVSGIGAVGVPA